MIKHQFVCPVTEEKSAPVVEQTAAGSNEYDNIDEDDVELPEGWGEATLRRQVKNPAIAQVKAARLLERKQVDAALADENVPEDAKAAMREGLADGTFDRQLDETYPLPDEELVWEEVRWENLSPRAYAAGLKALVDAGFPRAV
jgi:hypothetical protein